MSTNPYSVLGSSSKMPKSPITVSGQATSNEPSEQHVTSRRRKSHRAGKKRKTRRKSFALPPEDEHEEHRPSAARDSLYSLHGRNLSTTSIDSEALLDHRDQQPVRPRRSSTMGFANLQPPSFVQSRLRSVEVQDGSEEDEPSPWDEGAPLLSTSGRGRVSESNLQYSTYLGPERGRNRSRPGSSRSSRLRTRFGSTEGYNVNYPPSVPGTPTQGPTDRGLDMSFGDAMLRDELSLDNDSRRGSDVNPPSDLGAPLEGAPKLVRRNTMVLPAEQDVCFPSSGMSELAEEEMRALEGAMYRDRPIRRRRRKWPDLSFLEEWSRLEKEDRTEERRVKRITEPQLVNGRLRPVHRNWYRSEEDAPYRFTYFNEVVQSTIHAQTISELVQPGGSFEELFLPDPVLLSDDSDSEDEEEVSPATLNLHHVPTVTSPNLNGESKFPTRQHSLHIPAPTQTSTLEQPPRRELAMSPPLPGASSASQPGSSSDAGTQTPVGLRSPPSGPKVSQQTESSGTKAKEKIPRYGDRPVWWLDVLSPTEAEMKMLAKVFGIHPLTGEDIMQQEAREKVELFRHYYFVNYRTFDQDMDSESYLDPVNFYILVFRDGVLSFHFAMTPHCANVRRRVRQLKDYMRFSADWISYGLIDDITDVFVPLIQNIEDEVDEIDDAILRLHSSSAEQLKSDGGKLQYFDEKKSDDGATVVSGSDMLRRVGDCRKRVMSLYRLLGNKADVIKGFAKRCNEQWDVAPRSDIGMFLGDIQDHIVTMTANLSHYEKILARSHQNYLAQINIRMNERQEQTADVLGKLTVLGTIVLPMNIITGLWGMNVWVPGQDYEGDLRWFATITAGLIAFGVACYIIAKRVYNIV